MRSGCQLTSTQHPAKGGLLRPHGCWNLCREANVDAGMAFWKGVSWESTSGEIYLALLAQYVNYFVQRFSKNVSESEIQVL